jgi:hypothetical protein
LFIVKKFGCNGGSICVGNMGCRFGLDSGTFYDEECLILKLKTSIPLTENWRQNSEGISVICGGYM